MSPLLVGVAAVAAIVAVVVLIIASRVMRANHARQLERIHALQALASSPRSESAQHEPAQQAWDHMALPSPPKPAPRPDVSGFTDVALSATPHLFEESAEPAGRRWPVFVAGVLIIATGAGLVYILSSGIVGEIVTASPARSAEPAAATVASPIELLSLRHATESQDAFVVTGLVQNPAAGATLRGVFAMVYLFDSEGRYFASTKAALDAATLSAGGQSAFTVRVPATAGVTKYRVSFQLEDGAAVNHVDRRGTLPDNTTGDALPTPEKRKQP